MTTHRTSSTSQRAVLGGRRCECGGRIEPTTNGNGAVVDQCSRCGAKPGQGRALAPSPGRSRTLEKCSVKGCPGQLDAAGLCSCCAKRNAWAEAHTPKRHCEICEGTIVGRGSKKYCEACKPIAQRAAVAAHHAANPKAQRG